MSESKHPSTAFEAYDLPVARLVEFYRRLNAPVTYPDRMTTSLGIIYWGRDEHLEVIANAAPRLIESGITRFSQAVQALKTPARLKKLAKQSGVAEKILRILKHDLELWLPEPIELSQFDWLKENPGCREALLKLGLGDQLAVIAGGQTSPQRLALSSQGNLEPAQIEEAVKLCDFYRTGKTLGHIRAKIYYAMGLDTWQKWAGQTSEEIIALFAQYVQENHLSGERLIPWPKEVRNGIEWAKMHLEIYAVEW